MTHPHKAYRITLYCNVSTVGPQTVYSHPPVATCKQRAALTIALFSASNDLGVWALNLSGALRYFDRLFVCLFVCLLIHLVLSLSLLSLPPSPSSSFLSLSVSTFLFFPHTFSSSLSLLPPFSHPPFLPVLSCRRSGTVALTSSHG